MIRLSEKQLHNIITRAISEALRIQKSELLTEMAVNRKDYKSRIEGISSQIIENWCLVRYCSLVGQERYKIHWSKELFTHMSAAAKLTLSGKDSDIKRIKALQEVWIENDYDSAKGIDFAISLKFEKEHIQMSPSKYTVLINECANAAQSIIEVIATRDNSKIRDYILQI